MIKIYILVKYDDVWNKTKKILDVKFHIKLAKVKIFNGAVNSFFFQTTKLQKKVFTGFV